MAKHEIASGEQGVHDVALTPSDEDEIIFDQAIAAAELYLDGSAWVYYTVDGTAPEIGSKKCKSVPPIPSIKTIRFTGTQPATQRIVKMISIGGPTYALQRLDLAPTEE